MNKPVLLVGIGQFGCTVADHFARTIKNKDHVYIMAMDTDQRDIEKISHADVVSLAHSCDISKILDDCDTDILKTWFPCDRENDYVEYFECLSMNEGANQWRMKALLAFYYYLTKKDNREFLQDKINEIISAYPDCGIEIYLVASLAGGTGAGLFLPFNYYVKRLLKELGVLEVKTSAILALPEICDELLTAEQKIKAHANCYASLAELNAITTVATGGAIETEIKIGNGQDPYMGLLYDSEDEFFKLAENKPFNKVYLFRKIPGVKSVLSHATILKENINALLNEESVYPAQELGETIYGGFNLSKTVYSTDSILSYISACSLHETASSEWTYLYNEASRELTRMRNAAFMRGKEFPENAENIVTAVETAVNNIYTSIKLEAFSALLGRQFEDPSRDNAPPENIVANYVNKILANQLDEEFACPASAELEEILESHGEVTDENGKAPRKNNKKKSGIPFLSIGAQKKATVEIANTAGELILDSYQRSLELVQDRESFLERIYNGDSPASLVNCLLKHEGKAIHPLYALVCLCQTYSSLRKTVDKVKAKEQDYIEKNFYSSPEEAKKSQTFSKSELEKRTVLTSLVSPIKPKRDVKFEVLNVDLRFIPRWLMAADKNVTMKCKYGCEDTHRLMRAIQGDTSRIGSKKADETLLCYDLGFVYRKLKNVFHAVRMEQYLEIISKLIVEYYNLFKLLSRETDDLDQDSRIALMVHTEDANFTYFLGASEGEKKYIYGNYLTYLAKSKLRYTLFENLDAAFGQYVIDNTDITREIASRYEDDPYLFRPMFDTLREVWFNQLKNSEYYETEVRKNVLDALLSQSSAHGGHDNEFALSKALLSKSPPVRYSIPDIRDEYPVLMAMTHRVIALLPPAVEDYIKENSKKFNNKAAEAIMESLFFGAGEAYGTSDFRSYIPENEMHVFREELGIKLCFIDEINKYSDNPAYVKDYHKALAMRTEQITELWNPHLVCTLKSDCLPPII